MGKETGLQLNEKGFCPMDIYDNPNRWISR
jgi:hypothetical protein